MLGCPGTHLVPTQPLPDGRVELGVPGEVGGVEQVRVQVTICVLSHGRNAAMRARGAGKDAESGCPGCAHQGVDAPSSAKGIGDQPPVQSAPAPGAASANRERGRRLPPASQHTSSGSQLELTEAGVRRENNNSPRCLGRRLRPRRLRPRPRAACPAPARSCRPKRPRHEARSRPEPPQRRLLSAEATVHSWLYFFLTLFPSCLSLVTRPTLARVSPPGVPAPQAARLSAL